MFGSNNNDPVNKNSSGKPEKLELDKNTDLAIEKTAIHTLKKDLENESHPENISFKENAPTKAAPNPFASKQPVSERQRTSPFLSQESQRSPASTPAPVSGRSSSSTGAIQMKDHQSNWGKIVFGAVIFFIIIAASFSGYYFWMTRKTTTEPLPSNNAPTTPEPTQLFSVNKPNYLNIDTLVTDPAAIKEQIQKTASRALEQKPTTAIEFIVVDINNNPIPLDAFFRLSNMTIPAGVIANLGSSYSLFVYSDNNLGRLGLVIESKDLIGNNLKKALADSEGSLDQGIAPLLIAPYTIETKTFNTSYYGGAEIRYKNITSPEELSVDYTIFRNKLVIGTTKMTTRAMIDYLTTNAPVDATSTNEEMGSGTGEN